MTEPLKQCVDCGAQKEPGCFYPRRDRKSGLSSRCKDCSKKRAKGWFDLNPERQRANARAWAEANPEKKRGSYASWKERNKEHKKSYDARTHQQNKGRRREYWHSRRAKKRAATGTVSKNIVQKLLLLQRRKCVCCGKPLGRDFHLDHIVPLSRGGEHSDSNLQLLRAKCNLQKGTKDPILFMQEKGLLL